MKELLLGHRPSPRNWLLALTLAILLSPGLSWLVLLVPGAWLLATALPLILRTLQLTKNEELLASGLSAPIEARSYRIYLGLILQAMVMMALLLGVNLSLHAEVPETDLTFAWVYLVIAPFCHPLVYRKPITRWMWLLINLAFYCRLGLKFLVPLLAFSGVVSLIIRLNPSQKKRLLDILPLPGPSTDNPYEFRVCCLLARAPYRNLVVAYWASTVAALYWLMLTGEHDPLHVVTPALGCAFLFLLCKLLHKERSLRCHELSPIGRQELLNGLSRPLALLARNCGVALAVALLPLFYLCPNQWDLLFSVTLQVGLVAPLSYGLMAPLVFRSGMSQASPVSGFWLSILVAYLAGLVPGFVAEGAYQLCIH